MKKLCVVFKEGHDKNSPIVKKVKETVAQYGWKLLHEVSQFNESFPLIHHYVPLAAERVDAVSAFLYNHDQIKQHSFPPMRSCDG